MPLRRATKRLALFIALAFTLSGCHVYSHVPPGQIIKQGTPAGGKAPPGQVKKIF
ncbi:MAG: hypothetical protein V3S44_03140 [Alphaproteobacteria bacterium]